MTAITGNLIGRARLLIEDMATTGATFVQTGDGAGTADSLRLLDRKNGVAVTLTLMSPGFTIKWDHTGPDRAAALAGLGQMVRDTLAEVPA